MAEPTEAQEPPAQSPGRPSNMIRIDLNGVMLELPDVLINQIIAEHLPDFFNSTATHTAKERVMRLTMKGAMRLFLGYVEGQIKEKQADMPLPMIPTDENGDEQDVLEYGVYYILALGLAILTRSDMHAEIEQQDDGTLRITRLTATTTDVVEAADIAGYLGAGKDAQSGASQSATTDAPTAR